MKKLTVIPFWLAILIVLFGIYKFAQYKIDMYYSNLAPKQLDDDNTYGVLKFHSTVSNIALIIFVLLAIMLIYRVLKIWFKNK